MNKVIGNRYALIKKIGSGGMADVYLAKDTVLNREVAVKILRGSLSHDPVSLLRFQREAQAASGLDHINIVDVYDVGEDDGQHYIVMEMIHGTTLKDLLNRRGALDKYEAVSIMEQLSSALKKAHEKGIVHRDIKPQNILIKDDGTVKIADFGIALANDALQLTRQDSVMGSVHYLAPECSRGEGAGVKSDIYALGIVFYELLTGKAPYNGDNAVEIAMKHMKDDLPSVQEFNPSIPNSIVNIISKSTHKNKHYRYNNMDEFIIDLSSCLDTKRIDEEIWKPIINDSDETILLAKIDGFDEKTNHKKKKHMTPWLRWLLIGTITFSGIILMYFITRPKKVVEIEIPDLSGKTLTEVREIVEDLGLNLNPNHIFQYSDEFEYLEVIDSIPKAHTKVQKGSQIKLVISQGKTFEISDYKGKHISEVRELLSSHNITIRVVEEPNKDIEEGIVIRQEGLIAGDKIKPDQRNEIVLIVSSNMALVIPDSIIGMSPENAKKNLEDMGLLVKLEEKNTENLSLAELENLKYDVVISSNPTPGSYYVQEGSNEVILYYYSKPNIPEVSENRPEEVDDVNSESEEVSDET